MFAKGKELMQLTATATIQPPIWNENLQQQHRRRRHQQSNSKANPPLGLAARPQVTRQPFNEPK